MKIGVLLSGCGVYDGAEIQEAVLTLLAIDQLGWESVCISIDRPQHHVINHTNGEEMAEIRNMLVESSRIARGKITSLENMTPADIDALVIPGGFGSAKNFTSWAFDGPNATILPEVKLLLVNLVNVGKPIVALCVSPVVLAKAFEGSSIHPTLSLGSTIHDSPYDILSFHEGLHQSGANPKECTLDEVLVDETNRIICAPCYMMDASIGQIHANIQKALRALSQLI
ncbi:MAG: isoprenoid biosynthesis protein ElbB [Flavobacteriia bacterium]|nr:isoprenoid biosynthesis protein ElbB [Flavobacteriia bacterium]